MNKQPIFFIVLVLSLFSLAFGQPAPRKEMLKELNLTDAQKEQFEKTAFDTQKKQIDINAKIATAKLELHRILTAETLDKAAAEKKMNEIAVQEVAQRMNRLNAWADNYKMLNADQQKIWKKMLERKLETMDHPMMQKRMQGGMMHERRMDGDAPMPMMERKMEKK